MRRTLLPLASATVLACVTAATGLRLRGIVEKTLTCDCGFIARASDDVGLATEVVRHAWEAHGMPLSHDEALVLLFHAELAGATAIPARPPTATETEEQ